MILIVLPACGGGNVASTLAKPPEYPTAKEAKCGVVKSQSEPLVVEWPDAARGKLESLRKQGTVAVRYEGCELQVLRCHGKAQYQYSPLTRKQNRLKIGNEDELYANLPIGAVRLEGKLKTSGQLNVEMTLVGRFELADPVVSREDLEGDDCSAATHVVGAVTVGAFTFYAGADAAVGGGASVLGVGQGASSSAVRELLQRDGDDAACARSTSSDKEPPDGCGGLIRLEVVPLGASRRARAAPIPPRGDEPLRCGARHHVEHGECVDDSLSPAPVSTWSQPRPERTSSPAPQAKPKSSANDSPVHIALGWITLGALTTSGVAALAASVNASAVTDPNKGYCNKDKQYCSPEGISKRDAAITWGWVSTISLGVGLTSWALFYAIPRPRPAVSVGLAPMPGGGALSAQGSF